MRILLIHQYFLEKEDAGGSRFNEMTKIWAEKGHEITVLAGMVHAHGNNKPEKYKGKFFAKEQYEPNIEVIRSHVSESYNANFVGRLWGYFSFVFSAIMAGLFKARGKYDLILVTSPPLFVGITAYVLSLFKRLPIVFEIRDLWPESAVDTGVLKSKMLISLAYKFEAFIYRSAKLINVLTPAFRKVLLEEKGVPEEKVILIPNAADFSLSEKVKESDFDRADFRAKQGINGELVISYVGAHGVANHLIQVLETAELLRDEPVIFQLIGGGMQKPYLQEEVQKRELKNVHFIDPVPKQKVFEYIMASDLGASVLKKVDTFKTIYSNKTFDYMSCKVPVLMVIDGISRELIEEAKGGTYVEPENPQIFASKVKEYINNPDRIAREGENGYQFAKRNFDRKVLADKYLNYLKEVAQR